MFVYGLLHSFFPTSPGCEHQSKLFGLCINGKIMLTSLMAVLDICSGAVIVDHVNVSDCCHLVPT